ncbi:unnamed protein product, partial [Iphiclides podalirius]
MDAGGSGSYFMAERLVFCRRCRQAANAGRRSARGGLASLPNHTEYTRFHIRSDMKNLEQLLAVPISELVTFTSLANAATLLTWTKEGRSARKWSAGDRGRRACRRARFPHHTHPPILC